uniref:Uncharacterized protein n=1 Tax=Pyxicephalus adspersus TaxID=30357 RepID=A0AAV3AN73_PYXAD|nr:TPA: hypothetical protein GDO54_010882 [Pyxicephalus adspersus]
MFRPSIGCDRLPFHLNMLQINAKFIFIKKLNPQLRLQGFTLTLCSLACFPVCCDIVTELTSSLARENHHLKALCTEAQMSIN